MSKSILALGHSFVVDTNREVFSEMAQIDGYKVDIMVPKYWKSNLIKNLSYQFHENTDQHFDQIIATQVLFKGNASFFIFNPITMYKTLRAKKYDRIFLAQETWSLSLLALTLIKKFTQNRHTKIDLWVCQNIKKQKLYWLRHFEKFNTHDVSNILHCCDEIKDVINWKGIENNCRYFPFSFNPYHYQNNYHKRQNNAPLIVIGHLGRLSEEKGIEQLLTAIKELQVENNNIHFSIAGGGVLEKQVQEFCAQDPKSRKFHGLLNHNQAHLFYKDIDLFVLTSQTRPFWKEQFGRVIIEAAASGCSFVGSNSGAIPEVMKYNDLPFVYEEKSHQDLISQIKNAIKELNEKETYRAKQEKRHKLAMSTFSHKAVAQRYINYLEEEL